MLLLFAHDRLRDKIEFIHSHKRSTKSTQRFRVEHIKSSSIASVYWQ